MRHLSVPSKQTAFHFHLFLSFLWDEVWELGLTYNNKGYPKKKKNFCHVPFAEATIYIYIAYKASGTSKVYTIDFQIYMYVRVCKCACAFARACKLTLHWIELHETPLFL
jgi:hypothetical protein